MSRHGVLFLNSLGVIVITPPTLWNYVWFTSFFIFPLSYGIMEFIESLVVKFHLRLSGVYVAPVEGPYNPLGAFQRHY